MNIFYPNNLPIVAYKDDITDAISRHQVVVIAGDTGSGKTTQIPKICLEAFPNSKLLIGCTQPRRIAASTVASRVSEELGEMADIVGYKIRFHDYTSRKTRIKFMTDGVLLAETRRDPLLTDYGFVILDEAHERNLNIDFLLGYIKKILPERPDLKVIITSATIDTIAFARHFDDAPVISVEGRTYPVTVRYKPPEDEESGETEGYVEQCADSIVSIYVSEQPGDILAFLPTEKDIRACCSLVAEKAKGAVVLPMFGRLQAADQKRIFQNFSATKIVIATNVAETSITVPGIRYVVDSGLARMSFYNSRAKTTSLPVQKISRASSNQRKGRCGRIGPGICIRLYSEDDFNNRDEFTLPEIKRANLADVVLQMTSLNLGRPDNFPFIDPPHRNAIRDGYKLLLELGALTSQHKLTKYGRFMAQLPIDPCIARILLEAQTHNCLREVKIIATALAIQDPRIRPAEREKDADAAHKAFAHPHSDFMALLNIWNHFHEGHGATRSWSKLKKYCKTHFLSFQRMREWMDLHEQLTRILKNHKDFTENQDDASYEQIHIALASGFLRNIARRKKGKIYQGAGNHELMIFPGSHQFLKGGQWIIAASFLETNRLYALCVATIEPDWLEKLAPHLCKYSWTSPRWSGKTGQVTADEKVTLFGLIIVSGRLVNFGKRDIKNRAEARDIFIQSALIQCGLRGNYAFLSHNTKLLEKWRETENKLRRTSILHDDTSLFEFYASRLPDDIYDRTTLNKYLKRKNNQNFLKMTENDILRERPAENELANFPAHLQVGSLQLQLQYNFSPGSEDDGVTVRIPASFAPTLSPAQFEWLVPGLLPEKITFLLKGLPKSIRKHLVPVSNSVDTILDDVNIYKGSLYNALESSIFKQFKISVQRIDWPTNLPRHLTPRYTLFDIEGHDISSGRDLREMLQNVKQVPLTEQSAAIQPEDKETLHAWKQLVARTWEFEGLPMTIPLLTPQRDIAGYMYPVVEPLPDQGGVTLNFVTDQQESLRLNREGVAFLYRLQFPDGYKALKKYCATSFSGPSSQWLLESGQPRKEAVDSMLGFILRTLFPEIDGSIPPRKSFFCNIEIVRKTGFFKQGQEICEAIMALLRQRRKVLDKLYHFIKIDKNGHIFSVEKQEEFKLLLEEILPFDFLKQCTYTGLDNCSRQMRSLEIRLERFHANPTKDYEKRKQLAPHLQDLEHLGKKEEELSDEARILLHKYRELVAEFRISLFSPEIKTRLPVSAKRLKQLRQMLLAKCSYK